METLLSALNLSQKHATKQGLQAPAVAAAAAAVSSDHPRSLQDWTIHAPRLGSASASSSSSGSDDSDCDSDAGLVAPEDAVAANGWGHNNGTEAASPETTRQVLLAPSRRISSSDVGLLSLSPSLPWGMQREHWKLTDYRIVERLYTGYASVVYKAQCVASKTTVVLKVYTLSSTCELYQHQIFREVRLHANLQHRNIIGLYAAFQERDRVVLVQEYAGGNDLFNLLHHEGGRLSERRAVELVMEPFLRALHYLHSRHIVHRDIKPENILFTKDMVLKLCDFGLAIDLRAERAVTRAGTLDYMAPEVLNCPYKSKPEENKEKTHLHYSNGVDAWSVGVLAYELIIGCPPFFDQSKAGIENRIRMSLPSFPSSTSEEAKAFITSALQRDADKRPTVLDMLNHPWISSMRGRRSLCGPRPVAGNNKLSAAFANSKSQQNLVFVPSRMQPAITTPSFLLPNKEAQSG